MKAFYQRFKLKYGINDKDAIIVLLVFTVTGSLSVKLGRPVLAFFQISSETMSAWTYWPLRVLVTFPIYQILLLAIGSSLGQFKFFWQFQKKMILPFGRLFGYNPNKQSL